MKKFIIVILAIFLLNSCATILNSKKAVVKISSDNKSEIIFKKDTLAIDKKQITLRPSRSNKKLEITVLKDSLAQKFYFDRKLSNLFFFNLLNNYGAGMLVDLTNNKRFTYKRNIHFITDTITNTIKISNKKIETLPKNKLFVYTSPLQFLDFISIPMATLGAEYFIADNFSLSAAYGVKIADNFRPRNEVETLKDKAISYRLETKLYNKINLLGNVHINEYLALEFREIKSQYNDKLEYGLQNDYNEVSFIKDNFATQKRVTIINLKYGFLVPIGKRFYFDIYYGLGVRIKKFTDFGLEFDNTIHEVYGVDDFLFFDIKDIQDDYTNPLLNITAGFKIGFKL